MTRAKKNTKSLRWREGVARVGLAIRCASLGRNMSYKSILVLATIDKRTTNIFLFLKPLLLTFVPFVPRT